MEERDDGKVTNNVDNSDHKPNSYATERNLIPPRPQAFDLCSFMMRMHEIHWRPNSSITVASIQFGRQKAPRSAGDFLVSSSREEEHGKTDRET